MQSLWKFLERVSSGWRLAVLLGIVTACTIGFMIRGELLDTDLKSPDSSYFGYTPEFVADFLIAIGPEGRLLYGVTQLTLDLLYPVAYGTLIGVCLIRFYSLKQSMLLLPGIAVAADLIENGLTAYLALSDSLTASPLASIASVATRVKWFCIATSAVAICLGPLFRKDEPRLTETIRDLVDETLENSGTL